MRVGKVSMTGYKGISATDARMSLPSLGWNAGGKNLGDHSPRRDLIGATMQLQMAPWRGIGAPSKRGSSILLHGRFHGKNCDCP